MHRIHMYICIYINPCVYVCMFPWCCLDVALVFGAFMSPLGIYRLHKWIQQTLRVFSYTSRHPRRGWDGGVRFGFLASSALCSRAAHRVSPRSAPRACRCAGAAPAASLCSLRTQAPCAWCVLSARRDVGVTRAAATVGASSDSEWLRRCPPRRNGNGPLGAWRVRG